MNNNFLLLAIFAFCLTGKSQLTTIQFSDSLFPQENESHGFTFLFDVNADSVSTRFGVFHFKYPKNFQANDTAYCSEYFVGFPGKRPRGISMLVANYKSGNPTLYIDRNNNLDFGDDYNSPISFRDSSTFFVLTGKSDPKEQFGMKYWIDKLDTASTSFHDKMFNVEGMREKGIDMMSSLYWFKTKRYESRITKTTLNGDSVKVALHDYNINGRFDDAGKDMIFFGEPNFPFDADLISGALTLDTSATLFSFHNQVYKVIEVDPFGKFITIEPSNLAYEKSLGPGDPMPNLMLPTPQGDSLSLKSMIDGKHYLVIDMWADWCKPCHASAPKLKEFAEKHRDKVKMLGVSPHNLNDAVANYTTKYGHDWTQALTTKEFMKTFLADEYPRYILIDPKGKIVSLRTYPHQIEELIE
ncbi:thiol-disulfide isomerase-like thioredoxin [Owenweeksia hongkongensis DSM 17368]|uniref:Thiol-disulfide isomerase-like thioredoxin n=1 Tax=Owenweeksia hongkongensis (strain DSM 17368 / CIP 108786 / JCM 12287 / NRRL B-23963 / UST20020801) TaxID=926562 RepID=G8R8E0_OWEHD|nr:TlpA disulfide reductase family protein [Owenweeksia hongkongensis]AEV33533.1 thiol-disulfide isomerase-like thioredoxin [Owenweeksia hongkongensis DSM 17368]